MKITAAPRVRQQPRSSKMNRGNTSGDENHRSATGTGNLEHKLQQHEELYTLEELGRIPMYKSLLFGLLAALILFTGCSEDSPTDNNTTPDNFAFSAEINGNTWKADTAVYRVPVLPGFAREIAAWQGQENLGERITISLNKTTPGTYPLTGTSNKDVVLLYISDIDAGPAFNADSAPATEGSVTITEVTDRYIAGTFNFKATGIFSGQPFDVTEGAFKVEIK